METYIVMYVSVTKIHVCDVGLSQKYMRLTPPSFRHLTAKLKNLNFHIHIYFDRGRNLLYCQHLKCNTKKEGLNQYITRSRDLFSTLIKWNSLNIHDAERPSLSIHRAKRLILG